MITEILGNDDHLLENAMTFQQDGAVPHFGVRVRQFLNERILMR